MVPPLTQAPPLEAEEEEEEEAAPPALPAAPGPGAKEAQKEA
jgi:hypothetical protein